MRLLILRHAKSDWSGPTGDHERPLAARGRKAVPRVAARMRKRGYQPASVLSSTATRAMETAELLMPALGNAAEIRYDRALYLAEWPQLLAAIRDAATDASPLLVVGHNPGLEQLALALAQQPKSAAERARRERLVHKFPTAGLAVLDFPGSDWSEIKLGTGRLVDYIRPKDLDGESGDA